MNNEYIIVDKTKILQRIEEMEKAMEGFSFSKTNNTTMATLLSILKQIISQSTPLIPEIEKAIDAHKKYAWSSDVKKDYISNLKIDI
jgi:hypothetical protein